MASAIQWKKGDLNMKGKLLALGLSCSMVLSLAACGSSGSGSSTSGNSSASVSTSTGTSANTSSYGEFTTLEEGKLIMATNCAFPPYEMVADDEGVAGTGYEGIDVEIAAAVAEKLGLELAAYYKNHTAGEESGELVPVTLLDLWNWRTGSGEELSLPVLSWQEDNLIPEGVLIIKSPCSFPKRDLQ